MSTQDISEIKDSLARIETHLPYVIEQQKDHEKRLKLLEKYTAMVIGAILLIEFGIKIIEMKK